MKCILKKIFRPDLKDGYGLRTETVEGNTQQYPKVGEYFTMTGAPLDPSMSIRMVNTSPITTIEVIEKGYRVQTMSGSTYEIIFPEELDIPQPV